MNYQDMTAALKHESDKIADIAMSQILDHSGDRYVIEAVLKREMFVLACIAANVATRDCISQLDREK